jgi:hypothetical protein
MNELLDRLNRLDKDLHNLRNHVTAQLDLMQQELIDIIGDLNVSETPVPPPEPRLDDDDLREFRGSRYE